MDKSEIKSALEQCFGANVFTQEFINKWDIQKGSATNREDAVRIATNFKNTGFYTKIKTMSFDSTAITFWVAIKPK